MRLDFNILWVDDQPQRVRSTFARISTLIRRDGFRLRAEYAKSIEEAKRYLSDDVYGDHIDLVLMDYDLGAGGKGDDAIVEVRNIFQYKDIIFYSSQANDLPDIVAKKKLQGIFCSPRDSLHDAVHGVFDALMKKVLDIDHSRGIVMGATSDIDHYISDCLNLSFEKGDEGRRAAALGTVGKHLKEKTKSLEKDVEKIEKITHVTGLGDFHNTYTSNDRVRLLNTILEDAGLSPDTLPHLKKYLDRTVPMRNDLAHVRVVTEGFSRKLLDRHGKELSSEQMRGLRQELLDFQDVVEQLSTELSR